MGSPLEITSMESPQNHKANAHNAATITKALQALM